MVTLVDTPVPQDLEQGDQAVVWGTHWTPATNMCASGSLVKTAEIRFKEKCSRYTSRNVTYTSHCCSSCRNQNQTTHQVETWILLSTLDSTRSPRWGRFQTPCCLFCASSCVSSPQDSPQDTQAGHSILQVLSSALALCSPFWAQ